MLSVSWVLRRLAMSLVPAFWAPDSAEARLADRYFQEAPLWAVDEDLLLVAQGTLGVTLAAAGAAEEPDLSDGAGAPGETDLAPAGHKNWYRASIHGSADLLTLANSSADPRRPLRVRLPGETSRASLGMGDGARGDDTAEQEDVAEQGRSGRTGSTSKI